MASFAERATTVRAIGMWKAASSAFDSISVSTVRSLGERGLDDQARAVEVAAGVVSRSGPGVCSSSCWLR